MIKKSTKATIKKLVYPLAFILVIILSVVYKFVFKGRNDITVNAFKSGRSAVITTSESHESGPADTGTGSYVQSEATASKVSETIQLVSVYICGEVNKPGIYEAPKGVMLNVIIEDAGGLTENASADNINLVYQITGNMSIYIPSRTEVETADDLKTLPGIGDVTAQAIVDYRKKNPFKAVEDIKNVTGIGDSKYNRIKDYICV